MVFLMAVYMVMDSPFSPHPPPKNPQLPMPERNVKPKLNLRLMPLLMLIMVITVTLDTTDTADTMVDTTAIDTDTDTTDGANREIQCKTLILKERKNNCHQTKLNQKNAAT